MSRRVARNRRGQGLVEYALIIAGVALVTAAAVSIFGHKVNDMVSATAAVLPGAHADDNNPIVSGKLIETSDGVAGEDSGGTATTGIGLDVTTIIANSGTSRLGNNMATDGAIADLVLETP